MIKYRIAIWTASVIALLGAGLLYILLNPPKFPPYAHTTGIPQIGGAFTLTSHKGQTVTDKDFRGRYMLVFFGYTSCPDICPTGLGTISQALDSLGESAKMIAPLFITIDPARDTVAKMNDYVGNFHPSFVGLRGTQGTLKAVTKAYKVYAGAAHAAHKNMDHEIDHSTVIYLMGPDGAYLSHFSMGVDANALAKQLKIILAKNKKTFL